MATSSNFPLAPNPWDGTQPDTYVRRDGTLGQQFPVALVAPTKPKEK